MRPSRLITPLAILALAGPAFTADTYQLESTHLAAVFKISHVGFSNTYGRFNEISGTVVWDADPAKCTINLKINPASVDTNNQKRDDHLRNADFFDVKQFPEMTFVSTAVAKKGDNQFEVTGNFTMHGVTKAITVPVTKNKEGDSPFKDYRTGWDSTFSLKRSDYGMKFGIPNIGDEVQIMLSVEAVRK